MRSNKEIENEIVNRLCEMKEKRRRNKIITCGLVSSLSVIALTIFGISSIEKSVKTTLGENPSVASMFIDGTVGGYIAVAVISFVVGVIVTAVCLKTISGGKND